LVKNALVPRELGTRNQGSGKPAALGGEGIGKEEGEAKNGKDAGTFAILKLEESEGSSKADRGGRRRVRRYFGQSLIEGRGE